MKRMFFFALVNIAVLMTISIILKVLGLEPYMNARGLGYEGVLVWSLIWGMSGAFISLLLSKTLAIRGMGLTVIDEHSMNPTERDLVESVHRLATDSHMAKMPTVAIYDSPDINAFATGPSKNNSLVAVSTGLLRNMNREEVNAVLAHEVSHIVNGDMVTMTLIQGVINSFVLFFSRILGQIIANSLRGDDERSPSFMLQFAIEMVLQVAFGILGSLVVNWFSRQREFRADAGASGLVGNLGMIAALERLKLNTNAPVDTKEQAAFASLKISGSSKLSNLFSTHPSLDERIARLSN